MLFAMLADRRSEIPSLLNTPLPLMETGGVFAFVIAALRSMAGEAMAEEISAQAATKADGPFMMARRVVVLVQFVFSTARGRRKTRV